MKKIHLLRIISIIITLILLSGNIANAAPFSDVSGSHLNYNAISYVQSEGIVSGYPDGTYKPDSTINRAEFTKIIVGAQFGTDIIENCLAENIKAGWTYVFFPDVPIDAWYAKYICVAKMHDIIKGYPDGTFGPDKDINFAESSKIIVNAFRYPINTDVIWYKPFAEKLSEANAIPATITSLNKFITRGEMAEIIYRLKVGVTNKSSMKFEGTDLVPPESGASAVSATPAPSGCLYDNPKCSDNYECINNQCVPMTGCQYNNPECGQNYSCVNNICVNNGCVGQESVCGTDKVCIRNNCVAYAQYLPDNAGTSEQNCKNDEVYVNGQCKKAALDIVFLSGPEYFSEQDFDRYVSSTIMGLVLSADLQTCKNNIRVHKAYGLCLSRDMGQVDFLNYIYDTYGTKNGLLLTSGIPSDDCASTGNFVSIGKDNINTGAAVHEIGHMIGLWDQYCYYPPSLSPPNPVNLDEAKCVPATAENTTEAVRSLCSHSPAPPYESIPPYWCEGAINRYGDPSIMGSHVQMSQPGFGFSDQEIQYIQQKLSCNNEEAAEPLSYSTAGVSASVSKSTAAFDYTAGQLKGMAEECGSQHDADYFDQLVAKFSGTTKTIYNFKYTGASQEDDTFVVTLLPNKAGYTSLDQFKNDFDVCAAGGDAYPTMLNDNWLLFVNSCGSGFDDGSGRPIGCDKVREVIEPTLKLN